MKTTEETRLALVKFLTDDLLGPGEGETEIIVDKPAMRYSAGILFPQETIINESAEANGGEMGVEDESDSKMGELDELIADDKQAKTVRGQTKSEQIRSKRTDSGESDTDDAVTLANLYKPSAVGLSFVVDRGVGAIRVDARAAVYRREFDESRGRPAWRRTPLVLNRAVFQIGEKNRFSKEFAWSEGLALRLVGRPRENGTVLCTVSLFNTTSVVAPVEFFQTGFEVSADSEIPFIEYASAQRYKKNDKEEDSLALLYRNRRVFAIGHGCAADWDTAGRGATKLRTATIPAVTVPPVLPTDGDDAWLNMEFLSGATAEDHEILEALEELPRSYSSWIDDQARQAETLQADFPAAPLHIGNCRLAVERLKNGIETLRRDDHSLQAFKLMNKAMLRQQINTRRTKRRIDEEFPPFGPYKSVAGVSGFWRRFQIAFVLMSLSGIAPSAEKEERELVDLIWFPTGGGKTEAYLGLAAFTLFRRRFRTPNDKGCAILMRYTLRLLTAQQFQRAASLICACEEIRRDYAPKRGPTLGNHPFSIGLWVGDSLSPNKAAKAKTALNKLAERDTFAKNKFQLLRCPWCGTEMDNPDKLGYLIDHNDVMRFRCPADACAFSSLDRPLPVCVVDQQLYLEPPSLLIGTVDKFALLAWRPEARAFFGRNGDLPPELIIQDELHLISGPLGSMVGLYEGLVERLCQTAEGLGPKIIASTATIRRADDQCWQLYRRKMFQFPPQGLDASDSYFATERTDLPGRMYIGVFPSAASSPLTAQVRSVAGLLQGARIAAGDDGQVSELLDPYWTLVQYFSSLKELGRAATLVTGDIPEFLPSMQRRYGISKERRRKIRKHEELTSRKNEDEIPKILEAMGERFDPNVSEYHQPLDTVLATNMISVGVDVDRLGLMMIVTQPKGTSEYIQASSRVGRSRSAPGLVVTLYNVSRPRDRSHYEQFRPYHEAFYRYVEPTSVTPFSIPAMNRALHGVMVGFSRQLAEFDAPSDLNDPTKESALKLLLDEWKQRAADIDPEHLDAFEKLISKRLSEWRHWNYDSWGDFGARDDVTLMYPAGSSIDEDLTESSWATPSSLRNVDVECDGHVIPYIVSK